MHTYRPGNSIFDGPITSLPSVSCILKEIISRAHAKGGRSVSGFKFGTFVCRFPSDGAASMAEKELILCGKFGSRYSGTANSSRKSSATHSCQCVQYFCVSKQWYVCQHLRFLLCAQRLMHAVNHGEGTVRELWAPKAGSRKTSCHTRKLMEPVTAAHVHSSLDRPFRCLLHQVNQVSVVDLRNLTSKKEPNVLSMCFGGSE